MVRQHQADRVLNMQRTVVDAFVGFEVDLVVLERGHALREVREDVPLLDRVVHGQAWDDEK